MRSRTSSTRSFWVSIERLSIICSTQTVATRASSLFSFASRHSGPWPVKRSPGAGVLLSVVMGQSSSCSSSHSSSSSRFSSMMSLMTSWRFLSIVFRLPSTPVSSQIV